MKAGWQTKSLEEVCLFINGLWKGETPPFINVGVIRNTNFTKDGLLDDSDIAYLDVEVKKFEKRSLQLGDVILEKSGGGPKQPVGRVALFEKDEGNYSFSNFTSSIRIKNADELDYRYLHKFLYWIYLSGLTEGMQSHSTGIRNLDANAYKAIKITFPSVSEQKRILLMLEEAFSEIDKAISNTERNLKNATELFERELYSIFSERGSAWDKCTLKNMSLEFGRGKSKHRPRNDPKLYGGEFPFIQTGDIRNANHIVTDYSQTYNEVGLAQSKLWKKGTLCITIAANIAETAILGFDSCFPDSVIGFVADPEKTDVHYVEYLLTSFKSRLKAKGKGSAQDNINLATFENELFPFPSLPEQKEVVFRLNGLSTELRELKEIYEQKLIELHELNKAILQKAFSGELK